MYSETPDSDFVLPDPSRTIIRETSYVEGETAKMHLFEDMGRYLIKREGLVDLRVLRNLDEEERERATHAASSATTSSV